jgi:hypothetical protein
MTARQRKAQRHLLKRRLAEEIPAPADHLPETPSFVAPSEAEVLIVPPAPLIPIASSAFAIMNGLRGEL